MAARSEQAKALQRALDAQFKTSKHVNKIDFLVAAESYDLSDELLEICQGIPAGDYVRGRLIDQLNSQLVARGWESRHGTLA